MNNLFARKYIFQAIILVFALVLLARLFYIQVLDDTYALSADYNVMRRKIIFPARGVITDRNGVVLVQNEPVYDIMVIPNEVKPFDTAKFCQLIGIDKKRFDRQFKKARNYAPYKASVFEKLISAQTYASFQEVLYQFPGFFVQDRTMRSYPDSSAAHFLGYISEVTEERIKLSDGYYRLGDYIGTSGVERSYENVLRGQRGIEHLLVDSRNIPKGSFADGKYDTIAVSGDKLVSSLDIKVQKLGEELMRNKVGSVVAIEPATGEILAYVSSPGYDPNLLTGRERGNNISRLYQDPYNPFFNRPIQAQYPPGSSFKPVDGLLALQEGLIDEKTTFFCPGYYQAGRNHRVRCEHVDGTTNIRKAIANSCNTYFCYVFERLMNRNGPRNTRASYIDWEAKIRKFGIGTKLDIDLPHERGRALPSPEYYDKAFGANRWRSGSIISLSIGQGEMLTTPLQLANIECIVANRGYYYKPHLIKAIGEKKVVKPEYTVKNYVGIDRKHFETIIPGMVDVVEFGTAAASKIPGISFAGKTGTVQNPRGPSHSVFVGFAPVDNPKIAIAVVVENAGYGSSWAAPIASFMVEQYLRGSISPRPSGIDPQKYKDAYMLPPLKKPVVKAPKPKAAAKDSIIKPATGKSVTK